MLSILWVAAAALMIIGIVLTFTQNLLVAVLCFIIAVPFAGLAKVLSRQEKLLENQNRILDELRQLTAKDVQVCHFCGKSFGARQTSCPYCGQKAADDKTM